MQINCAQFGACGLNGCQAGRVCSKEWQPGARFRPASREITAAELARLLLLI